MRSLPRRISNFDHYVIIHSSPACHAIYTSLQTDGISVLNEDHPQNTLQNVTLPTTANLGMYQRMEFLKILVISCEILTTIVYLEIRQSDTIQPYL